MSLLFAPFSSLVPIHVFILVKKIIILLLIFFVSTFIYLPHHSFDTGYLFV